MDQVTISNVAPPPPLANLTGALLAGLAVTSHSPYDPSTVTFDAVTVG